MRAAGTGTPLGRTALIVNDAVVFGTSIGGSPTVALVMTFWPPDDTAPYSSAVMPVVLKVVVFDCDAGADDALAVGAGSVTTLPLALPPPPHAVTLRASAHNPPATAICERTRTCRVVFNTLFPPLQ